jgi:hypothetical protein
VRFWDDFETLSGYNVKNIIKYASYILLGIILILTIFDVVRITNYKKIPDLPPRNSHSKAEEYSIYIKLCADSSNIDWTKLNSTLRYIDTQYDCSDFSISILVRILYEFPDKIPADMYEKIKKTLLHFRYWMDEPGENSMCYWSENHQILFSSAEYLIGQLYPDEIFPNSGLTGAQHMQKALKRIDDWLEMRWKFGFSEFNSNVYYNETIAGMINLIDHANDNLLVKRTSIIMDLLIYDIASQKVGNTFVSVSGRAYERSRKGGDRISISQIINTIWGGQKRPLVHLNYGFVTSKNYTAPSVLVDIGKDTSDVVIKQSNGINISELEHERYWGTDDRSIMMQWSMEAFSNPEIIRNTIGYVRKNKMFSNKFVEKLSVLDYTMIRLFHLEPLLSRIFNTQANGTAIQRANTYTFRTSDYSIYSVQNYFPGNYANQVHVAGMNIGTSFSIFHTHPAMEAEDEHLSPDYWIGYGRLPHVVQDSCVSLAIYNLPEKKNLFEKAMLDYTHAFFPKNRFDSVYVFQNYAFGKKGNTYCALIGKNDFYYKNDHNEDLIQSGRQTFWITEAGRKKTDGSFKNFYTRILKNNVNFDPKTCILNYSSHNKEYNLTFAGDFLINNKKVDLNYDRYDSPYSHEKRKHDSIDFKYKDKFLHLDFYKTERNYN